jgi:hypothetical protein
MPRGNSQSAPRGGRGGFGGGGRGGRGGRGSTSDVMNDRRAIGWQNHRGLYAYILCDWRRSNPMFVMARRSSITATRGVQCPS